MPGPFAPAALQQQVEQALLAEALSAQMAPPEAAPAPTPPERDRGRLARYLALIGSNLFDAGTTTAALRRGAVEQNPLMKGLAGHPLALLGVKAGVGVGEGFLLDLLAKAGRRKAANVGAAAITGLNTGLGVRNLRQGS